MKHINGIWIGVLLITILLMQTACSSYSSIVLPKTELPKPTEPYAIDPTCTPDLNSNAANAPIPTQEDEIEKILNATVMIRMQSPQMEKVAGLGVFLGSGIGSLIQIQGEILLVTHNHWGEMLQDLTIVEFRKANNQMIKPIFGYQFKELILYQDTGTLVLRPTQELIDQLAPVNVEAIPQVAVGETVELVYRENPAREKAAIQQAVVKEILIYEDLPAYKLRSLDGQPIKPGDSGGGIWFQGTLVGNSWVTLVKTSGSDVEASGNLEEENIVYTDLSYAAILLLNIH